MANYQLDPEPMNGNGNIVAGDPAQRAQDTLVLGKLAETGARREVWLDLSGEQVVGIFGKRGTGKSYSLGVLIEGLSAGEGDHELAHMHTPRAGLVLDLMDIFWTSRIPLCKDGPPEVAKQYEAMVRSGHRTIDPSIDLWMPHGFENADIDPPGINPLCLQPSDLSLDDWGTLFSFDIYGEPRGMLLADVIAHVGEGYRTTVGDSIPANPRFTLGDLLACLDQDSDIATNYQSVTVRSVRQRLASYAALPLFAGNGIRLRELLKPFRTSVLMLGRVPDALKTVIVAVIARGILRERRDASFAKKRLDLDGSMGAEQALQLRQFINDSIPRTWVLMDEAHVIAGAGESNVGADALVKYAKEGRNYGLSLAVATQQPSALDGRLMSQVETLLVHQLTSPDDAALARRTMRSPAPAEVRIDNNRVDMEGLIRRLPPGTVVFSCGNAPALNRACVLTVRPRVTAHGGYEA